MTTFAHTDFNSSAYSAYRPTSHNGRFDNALDVATGTGQVAIELSKSFKQVYAIDVSSTMLQNAIKNPDITYSISSAEDLSQFSSNSIDLVTAAQSAHWFNITEFFKESFRVLKPQGTLAIWAYGQNILRDYPDFKHLTKKFVEDEFRTYWSKELDTIGNFYRDFKFPEEMFQTVKWEIYDANPNSPDPIDKHIADLTQLFGWKDNEVLQIHWQSVLILAEKRS
ncbi:3329_t:CDS:2 [Rhizophagus irregularis]|nr:3329_t:CDS:2 [Rhizophagus irregularis]